MKSWFWIAGLGVWLIGCTTTMEERVRDYNDDGVQLFNQGNYPAARESFQAALALKADDAGLLYNLGECYDRLGDYARAEPLYRQCLDRSPNHVTCRHALLVILERTKRRAEAVQMVEDWLRRDPKLAAAYAEDGWLCHQIGDLPRAQARLQQALQIDPHDTRALTELGLIYEENQRPERALVLYERILESAPNDLEVTRRVNFLLAKGVGRPHPE